MGDGQVVVVYVGVSSRYSYNMAHITVYITFSSELVTCF
jgi:hypothetical protein